jgi:hypothetical protein
MEMSFRSPGKEKCLLGQLSPFGTSYSPSKDSKREKKEGRKEEKKKERRKKPTRKAPAASSDVLYLTITPSKAHSSVFSEFSFLRIILWKIIAFVTTV